VAKKNVMPYAAHTPIVSKQNRCTCLVGNIRAKNANIEILINVRPMK
jgi:hypothetical protein